jgi:hypothetical protein
MELLRLSPAAAADERGLNEWKADASSVRSMASAVEG